MTTFSIQNFGCRATDADAAALRADLAASGLTLVGEHGAADVVVLNTCTVTASADTQARDAVRKIHRANPAAKIVVTGCYAQRAPEELAALDGVAYVVGNSHQSSIAQLVAEFPAGNRGVSNGGGFVSLSSLDSEPMSHTEVRLILPLRERSLRTPLGNADPADTVMRSRA